MSDPTTPPGDDDRLDDEPTESAPEADSEPIDVKELLESTRQLFEPEDLQRSLEQAGYTPESADEPSDEEDNDLSDTDETASLDTPDPLESEPDTDTGDEEPNGEQPADSAKISPEPEAVSPVADEDRVDDPTDGEFVAEESRLKGVNVLSIVALVLALALSPLAVIFGYIALGQTRRARQRGETMALWAIGLGWVVFAAWVVLITSLIWIGYQQGITVESLREFIELFSLP